MLDVKIVPYAATDQVVAAAAATRWAARAAVSIQVCCCVDTVLCAAVSLQYCVLLCRYSTVCCCVDTVLCAAVLLQYCVLLCRYRCAAVSIQVFDQRLLSANKCRS